MANTKGKKPMQTVTLAPNKSFTTFIEKASKLFEFEPHPSVQRGLDITYANALKKKLLNHSRLWFSPLGTILTIQRDGVDYVFDGQHRLQAIKSAIAEKESIDLAFEWELKKYDEGWDEFNQRAKEHEENQQSFDADALKKALGLGNKPEKPDTTALDAMLDSPVVVVRYTGDWEEGELKELFTSYNLGKRVSSNLLTTFASANEMVVTSLAARDWLGKYIEDKGGKNKCLFGVGDVCRFAKMNGEETTLAFLEKLFARYDAYDEEQRTMLQPVGLYSGWSRCLGVSVRTLNVISKLIPCVQTDESNINEMLTVLADAAQKLMADAIACSSLVPGVYNQSANGFVQAGNTVVEGLLLSWFVWQLKTAGFDLVLPKVLMNRVLTADNNFTEMVGVDGTVTPIADVIEVFSTLAPKPKAKASASKSRTPTMMTPDLSKEDLVQQQELDLDPTNIEL